MGAPKQRSGRRDAYKHVKHNRHDKTMVPHAPEEAGTPVLENAGTPIPNLISQKADLANSTLLDADSQKSAGRAG